MTRHRCGAAAAERPAAAAVDRYLLGGPGPQQQTRYSGGTDGRTPYRYKDPWCTYRVQVRYDTIRDAVLKCAQELTFSQLNLPYGTNN